jgi:hypothetical protein
MKQNTIAYPRLNSVRLFTAIGSLAADSLLPVFSIKFLVMPISGGSHTLPSINCVSVNQADKGRNENYKKKFN